MAAVHGSSLTNIVKAQAVQNAASVEGMLHEEMVRLQAVLTSHDKKSRAVLHEILQLGDLRLWVENKQSTMQQPLSSQCTPLEKEERIALNDSASKALKKESEDVNKLLRFLKKCLADLDESVANFASINNRLEHEMRWMRAAIERDYSCLTSATVRQQLDAPGVSLAVSRAKELIPLDETGLIGTGRKMRVRKVLQGPNLDLDPVQWEKQVNETFVKAGMQLARSAEFKKEIVETIKEQLLVCQNQRKTVVDEFARSIDRQFVRVRRDQQEIENLEKRMLEVKKEWRAASEAAQELRRPMDIAAERQRLRNFVTDAVGATIAEEAEILKQGRHELKKQCKGLSEGMKELRDRRDFLQRDIALAEAQIKTDRRWMTLENPMSTGSQPRLTQKQSIRTFSASYGVGVLLGTEPGSARFFPSPRRPIHGRDGEALSSLTASSADKNDGKGEGGSSGSARVGSALSSERSSTSAAKKEKNGGASLCIPAAPARPASSAIKVPAPPSTIRTTRSIFASSMSSGRRRK